MAGATLTTLAKDIREQYRMPFIKAVTEDTTLLKFFKHTKGVGKQSERKVHYGSNSSVASISEGGNVPTPGNQSIENAAWPMKYVAGSLEITGPSKVATSGKGGWVDGFRFELDGLMVNMKDSINTMLLATTLAAGTDINGIGVIIADSGTYAGLARGSYDWWKSYVLANGAVDRDLTISLLQDVYTEMAQPDRFGAKISHILGAYDHYFQYANLMEEQRRHVNVMKLDAGVDAVSFMGIPFVAVPGMAVGDVYFIDNRDWEYEVYDDFEVKPISVARDAEQLLVTHYAELVCRHTGRQARITDLL